MAERHDGHLLSFRCMAGYAAFLSTVQTACVASGLLERAVSRGIAWGILLGAAAVGVVCFRALPRAEPVDTRSSPFVTVLSVALTALALAIYLTSWVPALAKPDLSWDGNSYHVPMLHFWVRRGFVHWIDAPEPGTGWKSIVDWLFNGYPKGVETISFTLVRAMGTSRVVNTCNLVFLPLGVLGIVSSARALGASKASSLAVGAAFSLVPVNVSQGITTYVDSSLGYCFAALAAALLTTLAHWGSAAPPWRLLPVLGISLGLTAAAKSSGLAPFLVAIAVLAFAALRPEIARDARPTEAIPGPMTTRASTARRTHLAFVAAVAALATLLSGYWYVRTFRHTGNPLWPVRITLAGHTIFPGGPLEDAVSEMGVTPHVMIPWPGWVKVLHTWTQGVLLERWPESIRYCDAREGGLGYLWLLGCVPALGAGLAALFRTRDERHAPVLRAQTVSLVLLVALPFLVTPLNWWARYTTWLYVLGLPFLARALDGAGRDAAPRDPSLAGSRSALARVAVGAWALACFTLASYEGLYAFRHSQAFAPGYLDRPPQHALDSPRAWWDALTDYDHEQWFYTLSRLDIEAFSAPHGIGVGSLSDAASALLGVVCMPLGKRELAFLSPATANDPVKLGSWLLEHPVRYVAWRDDEPPPEPLLRASFRVARRPGLWRLFDLGGAPEAPRAPIWAK